MASDFRPPNDRLGNVVSFRPRNLGAGTRPPATPADDDHRERMKTNAIVFLFCVCFVTAGVWLMTAIATLPTKVDCNFSKHRPCRTTAILQ